MVVPRHKTPGDYRKYIKDKRKMPGFQWALTTNETNGCDVNIFGVPRAAKPTPKKNQEPADSARSADEAVPPDAGKIFREGVRYPRSFSLFAKI